VNPISSYIILIADKSPNQSPGVNDSANPSETDNGGGGEKRKRETKCGFTYHGQRRKMIALESRESLQAPCLSIYKGQKGRDKGRLIGDGKRKKKAEV
jgi:hypothetical protein